MSVEAVKNYFKEKNIDANIKVFEDTSTVEKAAKALNVTEGEIVKSLLLKVKEKYIMVLMAGDKRISNRKFKNIFACKPKMPEPEEVMEITGHPVGGVCPFALRNPIDIYLDISLKEYGTVYPAAGEFNAAVKLSVQELEELTLGKWIDISQ
ncbi:prolyl-tRNA editing protein [Tepidanaerobacter syntrophicus]|uniref:Cys-tRNA(Pro) deacylase, prolyl-tRNA editing enzyme YbaK/EbsC n=1 Tax=Tepidanaerobacter syntrophicus TaxID=224999 RepID=A0A0U9HJB1_9FIRM|nr:YbaK/EbsC family protein [Tepidanaerobacter syntrophicus]GAQ25436.1 Cys-tRNA(Pro) deacylase, prolyl-tRNA editing enzyme YbaK/EbsC [Tepidanaerobacter syntrophicus]GLI50996.1 prolyl-tRNA editing protein [Tepidanaerobacter syntrophicus]HHV82687.1 YbaK/EbsC family protein [Tepidanaerobacter syntrophicus]